MAIYIELDGERIYDPVDGLKSVAVTENASDKGGPTRKFTKELQFFGRGYQILKEKLIDPAEGFANQVTIAIYDDCCTTQGRDLLFFKGVIKGTNVDWCHQECHVKATASEDDQPITCLDSTLIYDNRLGFQNRVHPRMAYCIEFRPGIIHDLLILLSVTTIAIFLPFGLLIFFFDLIIKALDKIPGINFKQPLKGGFGEEVDDFTHLIKSAIVGCGRKHPSPLVRDYIKNVCDICGLEYESSILSNPSSDYYNTVYFNAPIEKGELKDVNFKLDNAPILSGAQLLEQLNQVFNAQFIFKGNKIIQERKDLIRKAAGTWVKYSDIESQKRLKSALCFKWNGEGRPSYGRFEYSLDPTDWVGNEAKAVYNDIVEWNRPFSPSQKGEKNVTLPFGPVRFRSDAIERDSLDKWTWLPFVGGLIRGNDDAIIMNNGTCLNPKLIVWDGKDRYNGFAKKFNGHFNYPYWFNEFNNEKGVVQSANKPGCGLYPRFWEIENPRTSAIKGIDWDFSFYYTCEELQSYDINKTIPLPNGIGQITSIEINSSDRSIKVSGTI